MHNTILQPVTIQTLQYFLTIWRRDSATQNNLEICSQSIFLWNPNDPDDTSNITTLVNTTVDLSSEPIDMDTLLDTFLTKEPEINPTLITTLPELETEPNTEVYQK
ncbi:11918_t:CDS:1, partial [Ambispora leptoticha]